MVQCLVQLLDGTDYEVDIDVSSILSRHTYSMGGILSLFTLCLSFNVR